MRCHTGRIAASGSRAKTLPRIRTKTQLPTRSSTDCRRRVGEGKPVWYLVPDGVVQYIAKHRLYRVRLEDDLSSRVEDGEVLSTEGEHGGNPSSVQQPTG